MKKSIVLFIVLLISCGSEQEKIMPAQKDIIESVYASVTIQPDSLYHAYASVGGILDNNLVEEGDLVSKDEAVLQIINTTPKLSAESARLALELAKENYNGNSAVLKALADEVAAAELKLKNDSINYYRQKNLWGQSIGSKIEYDNRKLAFELSQSTLRALKSNYRRTKNELETQVRLAENTYRSSQVTSTDFTVGSKINGRIYALFKNPGEIVTTMEPLAAIGSDTVFVIEMLVDEVDIVKLSLGLETFITLDAYNSEVFEATVSKIYPRKDDRSQTFKIEATFVKPPAVLYPGLSGEGNIIIAKKENVLTIPKEYLLEGNMVQTEKGTVEISIGLQDMEQVEVTSGLDANTYIYKPKE